MDDALLAVALFLLLTLAAGLLRVLRGPTAADRLMVAQLVGTTGIGILLLLAEAMDQDAARDVALILAFLASLTALAFVRRLWWRLSPRDQDEDRR
ncbi:monovalent cation/H+ antiporter complex subunit F [Telmatospirillum sp. J64-1]|uniref:monovalent cation/H+ antiporter complex subunit F n=1 Tax=Telmatospirillum sp. J64-1 TaxID=2502183 RepID=UPI00115DD74A|nr:monovalent cation/H+ antiporter complex subunit F [Telmatospirillum sp. J64-1]